MEELVILLSVVEPNYFSALSAMNFTACSPRAPESLPGLLENLSSFQLMETKAPNDGRRFLDSDGLLKRESYLLPVVIGCGVLFWAYSFLPFWLSLIGYAFVAFLFITSADTFLQHFWHGEKFFASEIAHALQKWSSAIALQEAAYFQQQSRPYDPLIIQAKKELKSEEKKREERRETQAKKEIREQKPTIERRLADYELPPSVEPISTQAQRFKAVYANISQRFFPSIKTISTTLSCDISWQIGATKYATTVERNGEQQAYPVYYQGILTHYAAFEPSLKPEPLFLRILAENTTQFLPTDGRGNGIKVLEKIQRPIDGKNINFWLVELKLNKTDERIINDGMLHPAEQAQGKPLLLFITKTTLNHAGIENRVKCFPTQHTIDSYKAIHLTELSAPSPLR